MLKSFINILVFATLASIAVVGLFIAWWIALFAVLAFASYLAVRRFFGAEIGLEARAHDAAVPRVIEGEYEVHPESPPQRLPGDKP